MRRVIKASNAETRKKPKYYIDSSTHRLKERAWQVCLFLLLEGSFQLDETDAESLFDEIVTSTINDEQASVSALQQLCLVVLLNGFPAFYPKIMKIVDSFGDEANTGRSVSVSGMLIVAFLYCSGSKNEKLLIDLVPVVLRLQQSNNYVVRIYAIGLCQAILAWFEQQNLVEIVSQKFAFLTEHVAFWRRVSNGNVGKNVARVLANPFISGKFSAPRDITLRAIFRTLIKLNGSRGVLPLKAFDVEFDMPISGDFDEYSECENEEAAKVLEVEMVKSDALQQKIAPWMEEKEQKTDGLVVCCSLLDKANNLGGITRTAEIFGASELVFDNLNVLNDKNYTALAVTGKVRKLFYLQKSFDFDLCIAMKWIKISEVKRAALVDWFNIIKSRGYQLVGLEQTTNSVEIQNYEFAETKTAIVLGNEREGIPVDLIPYFDAVIEIPQRKRLVYEQIFFCIKWVTVSVIV